ncbi:N-acetylglucosamine-6-phosphate deacetylase [Trichocoleus sp. FACHB-262]|uniref:N-acetylglucosamine-6-phosphate deacetylase n=1 Tax=Trichocoleus sp. FACHB-262 TaxID=2692869 RepID=UPI00168673B6|nr:N-acetylglucosamine-6-phosphate deacetylase [Trichocoleus sp. FACHB-262]MBD2123324.1 N-acetylglucosamine-6-phosphate deacetylase [Trichocoleus sp. FACHB-262]
MDIIKARVPGHLGIQHIHIEDGIIQWVEPMGQSVAGIIPIHEPLLDAGANWISLGGVDLQINGALGLAFPDLAPEHFDKLAEICQFLWQQGVDAFLPTIVTTSVENIQRSLATIAQFIEQIQPTQTKAAQILGVHLEGPFLNPEKRGAHPAEYLLPLTVEQIKRVLGDCAHIVKVITLAPELDPTGAAIAYLRSLGITISLGHSQATVAQAQQAFAQGATMVTHAFNAMPSLHHREPGLLGAAIANPQVQCGFIADGQHVSPIMLDLLLRASRYDQGLFLVSDALAPLGLPDGIYPWDTREIEVKHGTARLPDGTLSGTTLPLLVGVQNLVKWGLCSVEQAIALATTSPRRAIGLWNQSADDHCLYQGQPASNLLRWSFDSESQNLVWQRVET